MAEFSLTQESMQEAFARLNAELFERQLARIPLKLTNALRRGGTYRAKAEYVQQQPFMRRMLRDYSIRNLRDQSISISRRVCLTQDDLDRFMAHEMIHQWQSEVLSISEDSGGHGESFHRKMGEVNAVKGENFVTVTSDVVAGSHGGKEGQIYYVAIFEKGDRKFGGFSRRPFDERMTSVLEQTSNRTRISYRTVATMSHDAQALADISRMKPGIRTTRSWPRIPDDIYESIMAGEVGKAAARRALSRIADLRGITLLASSGTIVAYHATLSGSDILEGGFRKSTEVERVGLGGSSHGGSVSFTTDWTVAKGIHKAFAMMRSLVNADDPIAAMKKHFESLDSRVAGDVLRFWESVEGGDLRTWLDGWKPSPYGQRAKSYGELYRSGFKPVGEGWEGKDDRFFHQWLEPVTKENAERLVYSYVKTYFYADNDEYNPVFMGGDASHFKGIPREDIGVFTVELHIDPSKKHKSHGELYREPGYAILPAESEYRVSDMSMIGDILDYDPHPGDEPKVRGEERSYHADRETEEAVNGLLALLQKHRGLLANGELDVQSAMALLRNADDIYDVREIAAKILTITGLRGIRRALEQAVDLRKRSQPSEDGAKAISALPPDVRSEVENAAHTVRFADISERWYDSDNAGYEAWSERLRDMGLSESAAESEIDEWIEGRQFGYEERMAEEFKWVKMDVPGFKEEAADEFLEVARHLEDVVASSGIAAALHAAASPLLAAAAKPVADSHSVELAPNDHGGVTAFVLDPDGEQVDDAYADIHMGIAADFQGSPGEYDYFNPNKPIEEAGTVAVLTGLELPRDMRGRGLGREMVEAAVGWAFSHGAEAVYTHAVGAPGDEDPAGFYERLGFFAVDTASTGNPYMKLGRPGRQAGRKSPLRTRLDAAVEVAGMSGEIELARARLEVLSCGRRAQRRPRFLTRLAELGAVPPPDVVSSALSAVMSGTLVHSAAGSTGGDTDAKIRSILESGIDPSRWVKPWSGSPGEGHPKAAYFSLGWEGVLENPPPNYVFAKPGLSKPLVLWSGDAEGNYVWGPSLNEATGKSGQALTSLLQRHGYDSVITVRQDGTVGEIAYFGQTPLPAFLPETDHTAHALAAAAEITRRAAVEDVYRSIKKVFEKHRGRGLFVRFSDIPKIGIRPSTEHHDPYGVYFYPLDWLAENLEFGTTYANLPYITVARIRRDKWLNLGTIRPAKARQLAEKGGVLDEYEGLRGGRAGKRLWDAVEAKVKPFESDANKMEWNRIFGRMGVKAVYDPGTGSVNSSEPAQIVVLDLSLIDVVQVLENKADYKSLYHTILKIVADEVLDDGWGVGGSHAEGGIWAKGTVGGAPVELSVLPAKGGFEMEITLSYHDPSGKKRRIVSRDKMPNEWQDAPAEYWARSAAGTIKRGLADAELGAAADEDAEDALDRALRAMTKLRIPDIRVEEKPYGVQFWKNTGDGKVEGKLRLRKDGRTELEIYIEAWLFFAGEGSVVLEIGPMTASWEGNDPSSAKGRMATELGRAVREVRVTDLEHKPAGAGASDTEGIARLRAGWVFPAEIMDAAGLPQRSASVRPLEAWHGTSDAVLSCIRENGGLASPHLAAFKELAEYYADEAVEESGGVAVVLEVIVRDPSRLRYDPAAMDEPIISAGADEDTRDKEWDLAAEEHPDWVDGDMVSIPPEAWEYSWRGADSVRYEGLLPLADVRNPGGAGDEMAYRAAALACAAAAVGPEPWQVTQDEFIEMLNRSSGKKHLQDYKPRDVESFAHMNKTPMSDIIEVTLPDGGKLELKRSEALVQYGWFVQQPDGSEKYESTGERSEETVFAVVGGRVVGYAGPSFGATEMFLAEEEQGRGIGPELYKAYLEEFPHRQTAGGFTSAGLETAKATHRKFVEEAVRAGKPVPQKVLDDYPHGFGSLRAAVEFRGNEAALKEIRDYLEVYGMGKSGAGWVRMILRPSNIKNILAMQSFAEERSGSKLSGTILVPPGYPESAAAEFAQESGWTVVSASARAATDALRRARLRLATVRRYWHGSSGEKIRRIAAAGFVDPGVPEGSPSRGYQKPMPGRSYATTDLGYALIYAIEAAMVGKELPKDMERFDGDGGIVSLEGEGGALPDEDWVGELISDCENWRRKQKGLAIRIQVAPPEWKERLYGDLRRYLPGRIVSMIDRKPTWKLDNMATQSMIGKNVNRWLLKQPPTHFLREALVARSPHHSYPGRMRVTGAWVFDKREVNPKLKKDGSNFLALATEIPVGSPVTASKCPHGDYRPINFSPDGVRMPARLPESIRAEVASLLAGACTCDKCQSDRAASALHTAAMKVQIFCTPARAEVQGLWDVMMDGSAPENDGPWSTKEFANKAEINSYLVEKSKEGFVGWRLEEWESGRTASSSWDSRYPVVGDRVDGRAVLAEVPNTESISASFDDWEELPGIREVPMSDFGGPRSVFYAADDFRRSRELALRMRESGEIKPLIIAVDDEGPYLLEGAHRFVALHELGAKSFPALVVIDRDDEERASRAASTVLEFEESDEMGIHRITATAGDNEVGTLEWQLHPNARRVNLLYVGVSPDQRGAGVGEALLRRFEESAKATGSEGFYGDVTSLGAMRLVERVFGPPSEREDVGAVPDWSPEDERGVIDVHKRIDAVWDWDGEPRATPAAALRHAARICSALASVRFSELSAAVRTDIAENLHDAFFAGTDVSREVLLEVLADMDAPLVARRLPVAALTAQAGLTHSVSDAAVARLADALRRSADLDPVLTDGDRFRDGGHRLAAYEVAGRETIPTVDISLLLAADWEAEFREEIPGLSRTANAPGKAYYHGTTVEALRSIERDGYILAPVYMADTRAAAAGFAEMTADSAGLPADAAVVLKVMLPAEAEEELEPDPDFAHGSGNFFLDRNVPLEWVPWYPDPDEIAPRGDPSRREAGTYWYHGTSKAAEEAVRSGGEVRPSFAGSNVSLGGAYLTKRRDLAEVYARGAAREHESEPVVLTVTANESDLLPDEDWPVRLMDIDEDEIDSRLQEFLDDLFEGHLGDGHSLSDHYKVRYDELNNDHGITWQDSLRWSGSVRQPYPLSSDQLVGSVTAARVFTSTVEAWHGTDSDFAAFDRAFTKGQLGFHFGTEEQAGDIFGGEIPPQRVIHAELDIENPLRMPDLGGWQGHAAKEEFEKALGVKIPGSGSDASIVRAVRDAGYDGIVYANRFEGEEGDSYIVFDASQIRIIGNQTNQVASAISRAARALGEHLGETVMAYRALGIEHAEDVMKQGFTGPHHTQGVYYTSNWERAAFYARFMPSGRWGVIFELEVDSSRSIADVNDLMREQSEETLEEVRRVAGDMTDLLFGRDASPPGLDNYLEAWLGTHLVSEGESPDLVEAEEEHQSVWQLVADETQGTDSEMTIAEARAALPPGRYGEFTVLDSRGVPGVDAGELPGPAQARSVSEVPATRLKAVWFPTGLLEAVGESPPAGAETRGDDIDVIPAQAQDADMPKFMGGDSDLMDAIRKQRDDARERADMPDPEGDAPGQGLMPWGEERPLWGKAQDAEEVADFLDRVLDHIAEGDSVMDGHIYTRLTEWMNGRGGPLTPGDLERKEGHVRYELPNKRLLATKIIRKAQAAETEEAARRAAGKDAMACALRRAAEQIGQEWSEQSNVDPEDFVDEGFVEDESGHAFWGSKGSGILFVRNHPDEGQQMLAVKRSSAVEEPGTWGTTGGAVPKGESNEFASAIRETREEIGSTPSYEPVTKYVWKAPGGTFTYTTFVLECTDMDWLPTVFNWEAADAKWVSLDEAATLNLHFGLAALLRDLDLFG